MILGWLALAALSSTVVWWGAVGPPRTYVTATCRSDGPEAVWIAEVGTRSFDIIQVGTVHGDYFYAYGRGDGGPDSLYVEKMVGPADNGPHRYSMQLRGGTWQLAIDGRTVAWVSDSFRDWDLYETQVMAEGTLPMGAASCRLQPGTWTFGGKGWPLPVRSRGPLWWNVGAAWWRIP